MYLNLNQPDPDQIALIDDTGKSLTYGELVRYADQFSPRIPRRSLVFALATNSAAFVANLLALIHHGHVPLLLSADLERDLLQHLIDAYQPTAFLAPRSLVGQFGDEVVYADADYSIIRTHHEPVALHEDLELLLSTSGSTGSPKLVRFGKGNMETNARNVARVFEWSASERHIASLPLNYVMGLNAMLSHLAVGATVLLTGANLMEKTFWEFVRNERGSNFTGVPFSYELLLRLRPERMDLPDLRTFAQGGGKLSEKTFRRMAQLAQEQNWRFIPTYGTTETSARCSYLEPSMTLEKTLSIGRPIPEVTMELQDDSGRRITVPHTEGELIVRGPNVSMGYAEKLTDLAKGDELTGIYRTGDIAVFDEDGFYYIKGRTSRFIKMLGNRIGLDECEKILIDETGVKVTCIGQEDKLLILTDQIQGHDGLKKTLAGKLKLQPTLFAVFHRAELPRTSTGKINYHQLEQDYFG